MGGKSGGGARTPIIHKNNLHANEKSIIVEVISSGRIKGFQTEGKRLLESVYLNNTKAQDRDGNANFRGMRIEATFGDEDQNYLPSYSRSSSLTTVGAKVTKRTPVTRTVTNPLVTSLRVTVGVDALFHNTMEGDQFGTSVDLSVQIIKDGNIFKSEHVNINGKSSASVPKYVNFSDIPTPPFDIKVVRLTDDSDSDLIKNDTYFRYFAEYTDIKQRYPMTAVVGIEIDADQFGNDNPVRTYDVFGAMVQVPSNYDPETRTYDGLWDRRFKYAYTNNPAWVLYDQVTNELDGFGSRFKRHKVDIDKFYQLSKHCDVMVSDGEGGKEPRFVCNAVLKGGDAHDVLHDICSTFRGTFSDGKEFFTVFWDAPSDPVFTYNNSMVEDGKFVYRYSKRGERFNTFQIQFPDKENAYETTIIEIADSENVAKNGRIMTQIVGFGSTKRSYCIRTGQYNLLSCLTETDFVTFNIGAQGLHHDVYDIFQVADEKYVGRALGGRILSTDGDVVTTDRFIEKALSFYFKNGVNPVESFKVVEYLGDNKYKLDRATDINPDYLPLPFNATATDVEPRLFRCLEITEKDKHFFTVTAVQHNPQKQAIIDEGAEYLPPTTTIINPIPQLSSPTAQVKSGLIVLNWDCQYSGDALRFKIEIEKDGEIYDELYTEEREVTLFNLPQGEYVAKIWGVNNNGQFSSPVVITFSTTYSITGGRAESEVMAIVFRWELPSLLSSNAFTEVWTSKTSDFSKASKDASLPYPQNFHRISSLSTGEKRFAWLRIVDDSGNQGEFTPVIEGESSKDSDDILSYLDGKIGDKQISKDLKDQWNQNIDDKIKPVSDKIDAALEDISGIEIDVEGITGEIGNIKIDVEQALEDALENKTELEKQAEILKLVEKTQGDSAAQQKLMELVKASNDRALYARSYLLEAKTGQNTAKIEQVETVMTTKTDSLAERLDTLYTSVDNNSSKITALDKTMTSEFASQALQIKNLETSVEDNKADIKRVDIAVVDLEKSQAKTNTELNTKIEESESYLKLWSLVESTNNKSLAQNYFLLSAQYANSAAKIEQIQQAVATNELAITTVETRLNARIDSNTAEIERVDDARVTFEKSQASTNTQLTTDLKDAKASIDQNAGAISELDKAQAVTNQDLEAGFKESSAQQKLQSFVESTNNKSLATQLSLTIAQTGQNTAKVEGLDTALTTEQEARAEAVRRLEAESGANKASIEEVRSTTATVEGNVNSMWTMKLNANGASTGFMLGTDGEEGLFKVAADTFIVSTGNQDVNMFTIQNVNGKFVAALNGDLIAKGTISAEALVADSFKGYKIDGVEINAGKFTGGSIAIGGTATKPNFEVDENGNFYAKSGRFEGTVYADKIEGDVVVLSQFRRHEQEDSVRYIIPPVSYDRFMNIAHLAMRARYDGAVVNVGGTIEIYVNGSILRSEQYFIHRVEKYGNSDRQFLQIATGVYRSIPKNTFLELEFRVTSNYGSGTRKWITIESSAVFFARSGHIIS